jgi:hypothetical protein
MPRVLDPPRSVLIAVAGVENQRQSQALGGFVSWLTPSRILFQTPITFSAEFAPEPFFPHISATWVHHKSCEDDDNIVSHMRTSVDIRWRGLVRGTA